MQFMKKILVIFLILIFSGSCFGLLSSNPAYVLEVSSTSTYPSSIYPNSEISLNLTLTNISSTHDATNIEVSTYPNGKYFDSVKGEDTLERIKFDQAGTVTLTLKVKDGTPGGYYSIPIKITYTKQGEDFTINTQTTANVLNYDKIDVTLSEFPKTKQYLGDSFFIIGHVENKGNTTLKGITLRTVYETDLIPLTETSQFIGDILPNQKKDFGFKFEIPKVAETGVYDINLIATDILSNTETENISITVTDIPTLIISSIDKSVELNGVDQDFLTVGSDFSLSIQLENIAKSKAKSVRIEIIEKSEGIEGESIAYVGSIDEDDSGSGVFDLHLNSDTELGDNKITAKIVFTDEYDKEHTFTREISLFVTESNGGVSTWTYIFILLIIGGVIYYFYRKRKKKNKVKG
jgi:hypothetical protein